MYFYVVHVYRMVVLGVILLDGWGLDASPPEISRFALEFKMEILR